MARCSAPLTANPETMIAVTIRTAVTAPKMMSTPNGRTTPAA
ncbi:hypothetical protein MUS_4072 [Bacillus velezensis YAU B9601-Y2]|uniref:Uncharacterized protein n=1 Tax=Bacillus amyloliquefaciens (strain Y2) TaxID=1155777 RepID=I2CB95_BACAY|nr:hypothetical protein MUS_4072 [Bacillus velezensis YAU B9601-Y2]